MSIKEIFGEIDGKQVERICLSDGDVTVALLNYGAITQDWQVGARHVVLGFHNAEDYVRYSKSHGIIAGRVANRIKAGRFSWNGKNYRLPINNMDNHLHGGPEGLGTRIWEMEGDGRSARLRYHSPDGEMGYPGAVDFEIHVTLKGYLLSYEMRAVPNCETPINLAQHSYYNLNGGGDVRAHQVWIDAEQYTPVEVDLIPTGEIRPIDGTPMDFRQAKSFAENDPDRRGLDVNTVLREGRDIGSPCAQVIGEKSQLSLRMWTDQPALQIFNAPQMLIPVAGHQGSSSGAFAGFCLEAQIHPDAINHAAFPDIVFGPERIYRQITEIEISPGQAI